MAECALYTAGSQDRNLTRSGRKKRTVPNLLRMELADKSKLVAALSVLLLRGEVLASLFFLNRLGISLGI